MVNINLVPEKIRSAEALKVIVLIGTCSLALPVLFWGWRYQGERSNLAVVEQELKSLNEELASPQLREVVAAVEQFTKDQNDLDTKRAIVDNLRRRQVLLLRLMDMLPDIVPRNARISSMVVTDVKTTKEVVLKCEFIAVDAVASVYENLEASPLVEKVEISDGPNLKGTVAAINRPVSDATFKFSLQEQP